jgi:hypothetical protein
VDCPSGLDPMANASWYYVIVQSPPEMTFSDPYAGPGASQLVDCYITTTITATLTNPGNQQNWGTTDAGSHSEPAGSKNANADPNACN